jgi:hypothetical protein
MVNQGTDLMANLTTLFASSCANGRQACINMSMPAVHFKYPLLQFFENRANIGITFFT